MSVKCVDELGVVYRDFKVGLERDSEVPVEQERDERTRSARSKGTREMVMRTDLSTRT